MNKVDSPSTLKVCSFLFVFHYGGDIIPQPRSARATTNLFRTSKPLCNAKSCCSLWPRLLGTIKSTGLQASERFLASSLNSERSLVIWRVLLILSDYVFFHLRLLLSGQVFFGQQIVPVNWLVTGFLLVPVIFERLFFDCREILLTLK